MMGTAVMADEAGLPAPFEEAVKFIVLSLKHGRIMKGGTIVSTVNGSQICCHLLPPGWRWLFQSFSS
jgi:hypothetical protein